MNTWIYCPWCGAKLTQKTIEDQTRQCCPAHECDFVFWNNPIPVVVILVEYQNRFVITNNCDWPEWKYSLISGFVDADENAAVCVKREVKEELNLQVDRCQLLCVNHYRKLNQMMLGYKVSASGELQLNHENRAVRLLSRTELANWPFGAGATPLVEHYLSRSTG